MSRARSKEQQFRVVELFAGVGGFALGLTRSLDMDRPFSSDEGWRWTDSGPWQVTWANQWEPSTTRQHAADAYRHAFPEHADHLVDADIHAMLDFSLGDTQDVTPLVEHALEHHVPKRATDRQAEAELIAARWASEPLPDEFELLVGGFPCQDYSVAKTLSQAEGLVGRKGVLWWEIERIIAARRPPHVLLENVDRLLSSPAKARGRDFASMLATLAFHGYDVEWRVLDASEHGFPQRRRRVFIYATTRPSASGPEELARTGLFESTFPTARMHALPEVDLTAFHRASGGDSNALRGLLAELESEWAPQNKRPWGNGGAMVAGMTCSVRTAPLEGMVRPGFPSQLGEVATDSGPNRARGVAMQLAQVVKDDALVGYLIPVEQIGRSIYEASPLTDSTAAQRATWGYHKGAKRETRTRADGATYPYAEGAIAFPDRLDRPSRTIVTGEGGPSVSRFKHVVAQPIEEALLDAPELTMATEPCTTTESTDCLACGGSTTGYHAYRRLAPVELERLNMFADNWTQSIGSDSRRAFTMGNALVVGLVAELGAELHRRMTGATD